MKLPMLLIASVAIVASSAASASDAFDNARYYMGIKKNDEALRLIDGGGIDINAQTAEGYSLLHHAADNGNLEMVKALLDRGADPTLKSAKGSTPFDMATTSAIKVLLAKAQTGQGQAAAPMAPAAPPVADVKPGKGDGMCAAVRAEKINDGRSPALRPLLKARDAIWYNHPEELAALLDDCVDANATSDGSTLLHVAASRDRVDAAKILLARGASKSAPDSDGKNPAAYAQSPEMRALLGPVSAAAPKSGPAATASAGRKSECEQKYRADAALTSDGTGKARAYRRWQQCLKTGLYW